MAIEKNGGSKINWKKLSKFLVVHKKMSPFFKIKLRNDHHYGYIFFNVKKIIDYVNRPDPYERT